LTEAIERTILDYFEGWFEGDAARMERALHPELAKRTLRADGLESYTAAQMIEATAEGIGRTLDVPDRAIRIEVTHVDGVNASAVVHSSVYTEYVHLVDTGEGWKIVNTLWQRA
jgi:putative lumazine-binding protein